MTLDALIDFDQHVLTFFNGSDSMFWDQLTLSLTWAYTWVPLYIILFFMVVKNNETMLQIGLVVGCALLGVLLSGGIDAALVKPLVGRLRPCNDPVLKYTVEVVDNYRESDFSFFSAHAANTMSLAVFLAWLVRDRLLSLTMVFWSLLNGWTRLYLGQHFPLDVVVGWLWGAAAGCVAYFVFYKLYFKVSPRLNYISSQYTTTGYSGADIDVVMLVFVVTIAIVILHTLAVMASC